ncbi:hypothetical protein pipiens_008018 [Culex pipiens pipiens]|uniref:Uncharacterized protein n=1 Tax=Culex pipiens pipiens TaxID=38569 RepID=A0ABD1DIX9_CULPP
MFKLIVAVLALVAIASAFPSDLQQPREASVVPGVPVAEGQPQDLVAAVDGDEQNKEGLEKSETFGFGYYRGYPRYYGYGYGYPRYYGYGYPRYYGGYGGYYW